MSQPEDTLATQDSASELFRRPGRGVRVALPCLTILCHPDVARVGERAALQGLAMPSAEIELARLTPMFRPVGEEVSRPLADSRLSRQPILISRLDNGALRLDAASSRIRLRVDGAVVETRREVTSADLERGVVLQLGSRIVLCLHGLEPGLGAPPAFDLVGESSAMWRLRREIDQIADLELPVLVRGESGTGKELVARAIRQASRRREEPYYALNMAAIPANLAASELFGAAKGAFSGADKRRPGYFERADGGTLFLDEIGEMPVEVQALLLRALESGEIQPVGSEVPLTVDVRVVAATDADLDRAIEEGRFRAPLLHRLASFEIDLPPLRDRREDLGRLFFFFLRQEWSELAQLDAVQGAVLPKVDAELVARLAAYPWPGNVRQLRNVVRQLAVTNRGSRRLEMGARLARMLAAEVAPASQGTEAEGSDLSPTGHPESSSEGAISEPSSPGPTETMGSALSEPAMELRDRSEVSEDELIAALRDHGYRIQPTARALRISRTALYALIDACPRVRKAGDLDAEEIRAALADYGGRLPAVADHLGVSLQGLKMRIKDLGERLRAPG